MKIIYILLLISLFINHSFSQENIINELGYKGKFIVRDTDLRERLVIEDEEITIFGNLKLNTLPYADLSYLHVVWDINDKQLKILNMDRSGYGLNEENWHKISRDGVDENGNIVNTSINSANSVNWNELHTDNGYISLGPANTKYAHIHTDKSWFLFTKTVRLKYGILESHNTDLKFRTGSKTRIFTSYSTGNVGIGTELPSAKLEVAGQVKITGGSPGDGKVLTSDGTGLATWQTPTSGGGGSNSLWIEAGDDVYRSTGNVGIGTSSPSEKLEIAGSAIIGDENNSSYLNVGNNYFSSSAGSLNPGVYLFKSDQLSYGMKLQYTDNEYGTMMFGPYSANHFLSFGKVGPSLQDDSMIEYMRIDLDNGNVGIGTSNPQAKLDVNGTACVTRYSTKNVYTITNNTWDLSQGNIAEITFTSSINPISITSDGCIGTFVLIVKKSGSCSSCSLDIQGANILWAYGTAPTLSSGSNTTDVISLIAVGNNTYYGYSANNFY